ncbi:MAG: Ig-like domain-containing protein, partial [Anaerolineales bacterium]
DGGALQNGASVLIQKDGNHTVKFVATDNAGNATSQSVSFKLDQSIPTITFTPTGTLGQHGWYQSNVSLAITASDSVSGISTPIEYSMDNGATWLTYAGPISFSGDGPHAGQARVESNSGGAIATTFYVQIDTTPPTQTLVLDGTMGQNNWYTSTVQTSLNTSDATSGVWYSTIQNNGVQIQNTLLSPAPIELGDGVYNLQYTTLDKAGNSASGTSPAIHVDTTPPVITFTPTGTLGSNGWYTSNVSLAIAATDATSGVATLEYSMDNGLTWPTYTGPIPLSDGTYTIEARSTDNAGNQSTDSTTVKVDTTPPTQRLVLKGTMGQNNWYTSDVQASVNASDGGAGVASSTIADNGGAAQPSPVTLDDGVHSLQYVTADKAGNTITNTSPSIQVDTTAPVSQFTSPAPSSLELGGFQVSGSSSDVGSGLSAAQISTDGTNWSALTLAAGKWSYSVNPSSVPNNGKSTVYVRAIDQAGNVEMPVQLPLMLDGHSPQIALSMSLFSAGQGSLSVTPDWFGLKNVSVAVEDPSNRWPNQPINITLSSPLPSNSQVAANIDWNLAFGTVPATPGNYVVVVTACDINNICSTMDGNVIIVLPHKVKKVVDQVLSPLYSYFPPPPTPVPTQMATEIPIPASTPIPALARTSPKAKPQPARIPIPVATVSSPTRSDPSVGILDSKSAKGDVQMGGWLIILALVLAITAHTDPRPNAVRRLTASIGKVMKQNHK